MQDEFASFKAVRFPRVDSGAQIDRASIHQRWHKAQEYLALLNEFWRRPIVMRVYSRSSQALGSMGFDGLSLKAQQPWTQKGSQHGSERASNVPERYHQPNNGRHTS